MTHFVISILIVSAFLFMLALFTQHRRLTKARGELKDSFTQIDLELQNRNARIPQLIEISKRYLIQDRALLESLVRLRNESTATLQKAALEPLDANSISSFCLAEKELQAVLRLFLKVISAEATLASQPAMINLLNEETKSQAQISAAIKSYNIYASHYNDQQKPFLGLFNSFLLRLPKAAPIKL